MFSNIITLAIISRHFIFDRLTLKAISDREIRNRYVPKSLLACGDDEYNADITCHPTRRQILRLVHFEGLLEKKTQTSVSVAMIITYELINVSGVKSLPKFDSTQTDQTGFRPFRSKDKLFRVYDQTAARSRI